jgi:hypothetical protein
MCVIVFMMDMGSLSAQDGPVAPVHKVIHVGDLHNTVVALVERWRSADCLGHCRDPMASAIEQHFGEFLSLISPELPFS